MNAPPDRDTSTLLQTGNELFLAVFLDDAVRIVKAQLTCFAQVFNAFVMLARVEKDQPAVVVSFREIGMDARHRSMPAALFPDSHRLHSAH